MAAGLGTPPDTTLHPPPPVLAGVASADVEGASPALGVGGVEGVVPLPTPPSTEVSAAPWVGGTEGPLPTPPSVTGVGGGGGVAPLPAPASAEVASVPEAPPVPSAPPPVRVVPEGGWHDLLVTAVLSGGGEAAGPASTAIGREGLVGKGAAAQVHGAGQSASLVQVVTLDWQVPGYEVEVVQIGSLPVPASAGTGVAGGTGTPSPADPPPAPEAAPALADPGLADPVPVAPGLDAEQVVVLTGWQTKPSPQSASRLHGNCHRYAHRLTVESEQTGGSAGVGVQTPPGSHWTPAPLEQVVTVWLWQIMPWLQSASLAQVWPKMPGAASTAESRVRAFTRVFVVRMSAPPLSSCAARKQHVSCQPRARVISGVSRPLLGSSRWASQNSDGWPAAAGNPMRLRLGSGATVDARLRAPTTSRRR
jgi:hypothetical protein